MDQAALRTDVPFRFLPARQYRFQGLMGYPLPPPGPAAVKALDYACTVTHFPAERKQQA